MLQLGYVTIYRSAEICTFEFDSIKQMTNLRFAINFRKSKTGKYEEGKLAHILQTLVDLMDDWKHKADFENRKILRGFF